MAQKVDAAHHAVEGLARHAHRARRPRADGDQHRIAALAQLIERYAVANFGVVDHGNS